MASNNNYLRGDTNEIVVAVHGHTVVEQGDLMVINLSSATMKVVHKLVDYYGFSVSDLSGINTVKYTSQFAGIAMNGSKNGVTNNVNIATTGVFRMDLPSAKTIYSGWPVSGTSSATSIAYNQKIVCSILSPVASKIGKCVKNAASATECDFELLTKFSGVSYQDIVV